MAGKTMEKIGVKEGRVVSTTYDHGNMAYIIAVAESHRWSFAQAVREIITAAEKAKLKI